MQITKKSLLILIQSSLLLPISLYANCPSLDKVTFGCSEIFGKKHCAWGAPWWEGYQGNAEAGDHPVEFKEVFWGASSDPLMGSTNCFYKDKNNDWVELSQNNWGGVPKPVNSPWKDGLWPTGGAAQAGRVCDQSLTACQFPYGD